eukprot:4864990-Pyramimonas_sp.AAC.1
MAQANARACPCPAQKLWVQDMTALDVDESDCAWLGVRRGCAGAGALQPRAERRRSARPGPVKPTGTPALTSSAPRAASRTAENKGN